MVRNSSVALTVVVFTPLLAVLAVDVDVVEIGVCALCGCQVGVATPLDGVELAACWMSFPCSAINVGASFWKVCRSCGAILALIRSFTGCFSLVSENMSISNCSKSDHLCE